MSPCAAFEERLLDYEALGPADRSPVDDHVAGCAACHEFRTALARADAELQAVFESPQAPPALSRRIRAQVRRPSALPEILDGVGWLGVLALLGSATFVVAGPASALVAAGAMTAAAAWASIRSYRALRS
jgi:predicted anti-sigma-YlaC factor YlaD